MARDIGECKPQANGPARAAFSNKVVSERLERASRVAIFRGFLYHALDGDFCTRVSEERLECRRELVITIAAITRQGAPGPKTP